MTETGGAFPSPAAHPPEPEEREPVRTQHTLDVGDRQLRYEAEAGTVRIRRDDHSALADMFYVAYRVATDPGSSPRPVTFLFNGGPGSGSLWLNVGGFGPKRAPTRTPEATPPAPYAFDANPHTLLWSSDLVFLDAVGTGFSRLVGDGRPEEVWGVDQDIDAFARAVMRYLTVTGSWSAPRYLFGESYGTARAAGLVHRLQNLGLDFNGVILLSTVLNWATTQPGADQHYINLLPSFAAAARFHGRATAASRSSEGFLEEVREFAQGDYAHALQLGDQLAPDEERAVAERLAGYIGLEANDLRRRRLRVEMEAFRHELLEAQGKVIGRFDTRFVADHQYVVGSGSFDPATDDAATAGVNSAHLSSFHRHLAEDLRYQSDVHYRHLYNMTISGAWDWRHKAPGIDSPLPVANVSLDLSAAMRRNPSLHVYLMGGIYDLATPYFGAEFDIAHLYLAEHLRANVRFSWYESGHMTFVDERVVPLMASDLARFYADTSGMDALRAGLDAG